MQQHSGQHVLSAAFVQLFEIFTVSFHMGADYCSIDLDTKNLSAQQVEAAEGLANDVVTQNRPVSIRFVSQEEARSLGLRKLPPADKEVLRLIDIHDFDLTACGGTHVTGTGQIGSILLRKTEKVKQGWRVEFVCGQRAVRTARRDYAVLTEAEAYSQVTSGNCHNRYAKRRKNCAAYASCRSERWKKSPICKPRRSWRKPL